VKSQSCDERVLPKWAWSGSREQFLHCQLRKFRHSKSSVYRWYTQFDRRRFVYDTSETMGANSSRHGWVHMFITHCLQLNLQLHTIDLVRTCRISSFYTVVWQLTRFQLTRRIAWSLGDSWASCNGLLFNQLIISFGSLWFYPQNDICSCFMLLAYSQLIKSLRFWK